MSSKNIALAGGASLPAVGLGLWKVEPRLAPGLVVSAIEAGYRHLDGACDYGNESACGDGVKQSISRGLCTRDQLWVTSKLWNTYHRPEHVQKACEKSLRDWGLDYFDLYLIHFPIALAYVPIEQRYPPGWLYDPASASPGMVADGVP
ncbi:MAG: aldo/keto reductase, partial [Pirellulaceae bacterium]|nr:aldo/keto reductase [Pirellulaceae bacterium]